MLDRRVAGKVRTEISKQNRRQTWHSEALEFILGTSVYIYVCVYIYYKRTMEEDITVEITPGRAGIVGILCHVSAGYSTLRERRC